MLDQSPWVATAADLGREAGNIINLVLCLVNLIPSSAGCGRFWLDLPHHVKPGLEKWSLWEC